MSSDVRHIPPVVTRTTSSCNTASQINSHTNIAMRLVDVARTYLASQSWSPWSSAPRQTPDGVYLVTTGRWTGRHSWTPIAQAEIDVISPDHPHRIKPDQPLPPLLERENTGIVCGCDRTRSPRQDEDAVAMLLEYFDRVEEGGYTSVDGGTGIVAVKGDLVAFVCDHHGHHSGKVDGSVWSGKLLRSIFGMISQECGTGGSGVLGEDRGWVVGTRSGNEGRNPCHGGFVLDEKHETCKEVVPAKDDEKDDV